MKIIRKKVWQLVCLVLIITFGYWCCLFFFGRTYYYNSDKSKCLTVWEKPGGYAFIFKGKYMYPFLPKENYIKTDNRNVFVIIWNKPENYYATIAWRNDYPIECIVKEKEFLLLNRSIENDNNQYEKILMTPDYNVKHGVEYFELEW